MKLSGMSGTVAPGVGGGFVAVMAEPGANNLCVRAQYKLDSNVFIDLLLANISMLPDR